jgi:branched-chain amino acid transport system substrate-binding protein
MLRTFAGTIAVAAFATGDGSAGTADPIVIGMVAPLTGTASAAGGGHRAGAQAAVRELNRRGGVRGRSATLRLLDDASNPTEGLIRMQELVSDPHVVATIGSGFPATALATAPIATRIGIPYVSVAPLHTLVYPPRPYVYTTAHTTRLVVYKLAAHLRAAGITRLALLRSNTSVGIEAGAVTRELAARYRLSIVSELVYPTSSSTFVAELVRIKNSEAQAVWVWGVDVPVVTITKEFPPAPTAATVAARPRCGNPAVPAASVPGCERRDPYGPVVRRRPTTSGLESIETARPPSRRTRWEPRRHLRPQRLTAVMMLAQAMRTHGVGRQPINRALERMTFLGPEGVHRFTPFKHAGLSSKSLVLTRVRNCRLEPIPGQDLDG